jgi:hypothetical protein
MIGSSPFEIEVSARVSITSREPRRRATRIVRHSRVNSSTRQSSRIVGAVLDEVVGPDVVGVSRPQADARSV